MQNRLVRSELYTLEDDHAQAFISFTYKQTKNV